MFGPVWEAFAVKSLGISANLSHTALPFLFRGITMSPVIPRVPAIFPAAAPHRILFCFNYIDKSGFAEVHTGIRPVFAPCSKAENAKVQTASA